MFGRFVDLLVGSPGRPPCDDEFRLGDFDGTVRDDGNEPLDENVARERDAAVELVRDADDRNGVVFVVAHCLRRHAGAGRRFWAPLERAVRERLRIRGGDALMTLQDDASTVARRLPERSVR